MKVIQLDTLLHDIESGDAPVSGYAVVDWLKSKAFDNDPMPYLSITYSKDSIPIRMRDAQVENCQVIETHEKCIAAVYAVNHETKEILVGYPDGDREWVSMDKRFLYDTKKEEENA